MCNLPNWNFGGKKGIYVVSLADGEEDPATVPAFDCYEIQWVPNSEISTGVKTSNFANSCITFTWRSTIDTSEYIIIINQHLFK